jgi:predicted nucleic acid-binding protein
MKAGPLPVNVTAILWATQIYPKFAADKPDPAVVTWLREDQGDDLFLSVITIGEIQQGITRLPTSQKSPFG